MELFSEVVFQYISKCNQAQTYNAVFISQTMCVIYVNTHT